MQRIRVCAAVQVSPILRIPPRHYRNLMEASFTARTRRAPAASRWHSSHTGMSLPCAQKYPSKLAHSDGNRASRRSLATRAQSGLCRPICADYSAHKLHARCVLHRGCMRAAGICWIAPGKPPLVAYVCGTMLIVRSDRDKNPERAPLAARHDDLSIPCVCAQLGVRVRSWATAAAPHSVAYQVLSDWLFMASHRCARRAWRVGCACYT